MRSFSAADFLVLWERGFGLHAIDRALLVLSHACPEYAHDELCTLSLGQRDTLLLKVRQRTFGDQMAAYTDCPSCRESLEFSLSCDALSSDPRPDAVTTKTITIAGAEFRLRCPDSRDAAAAAASHDVEVARRTLFARCVIQKNSADSTIDALPEWVQMAIANELAAIDPQAEMLLNLSCPSCRHSWQALFDIGAYLWTEMRARARRLLQEVDALARAYGWSESEILAMSPARRGLYLQMATA